MKYKITIASLHPTDEGYDSDIEFLQVLELDESPAPEIARLLNPEPEYEEEVEEEDQITVDGSILEIPQSFVGKPVTVELPPFFGTIEAEKETAKRGGRQIGYDRDAVIADLKANVLTVAQIADKHGITKSNVYQIKSKFVREEEIAPDIEPYPYGPKQEPVDPPPTAYQEARERLEDTKSSAESSVESEIAKMVLEGVSLSELQMMYPSVPIATLSEIHRTLRR